MGALRGMGQWEGWVREGLGRPACALCSDCSTPITIDWKEGCKWQGQGCKVWSVDTVCALWTLCVPCLSHPPPSCPCASFSPPTPGLLIPLIHSYGAAPPYA